MNDDIKRWYDRDPRMSQILCILRDLPDDSKSEFARVLMQLINILRKNKKSDDDSPLSIGKAKVLGLYKASNKRRWYDQTSDLMNSLNLLSALDDTDFNEIVDGLLLTLSDV